VATIDPMIPDPAIDAKYLFWFVTNQIRQIREGGLPVLLRKVAIFLMMSPAAVVLLVALMAQPLVLIRFGRMAARSMGAFASRPELYLCERDAAIPNRRTLDIFFCDGSACNQQLKRMWGRILLISPIAKWPYILAGILPGFSAHVVPVAWKHRDVRGLQARTPAHLSFTAGEEQRGQAALRELGIPEGAPYICFFARDSAYMDVHLPSRGTGGGSGFRDCSINSYVPAAEELTRRGYFALRMGAIVKEALQTANPMILDYATKHRTDFLDIYLASKCRFFLGDPAGYICVPDLFRRPLAIVNFIPLEYLFSWDPNSLSIFKKLWLRKERRFMTIREILEPWACSITKDWEYEQAGIEVVDNTPEEVAAVAVEMDERLNGTWLTTEEDEDLQKRFWSLFKSSDLHGVFLSRIGAEFLRQNRELLE